MKIGSVIKKNYVFLAPMAGVNDKAFRVLCKKRGSGLVFTEMVNVSAIARQNPASLMLAETKTEETPVALQLFGDKPEDFKKALKIINASKKISPDYIDINMGCPAIKVLKTDAGCALMQNPKLAEKIIKTCVKYSDVPVTVKIRMGLKKTKMNYLEIARIAEKSGAVALTIHARTADQGYSGKADWKIIKEIKEKLKIPVIGNGDIVDAKSAKEMLDFTNCDAIMIGRAAIGNPSIFKEINDYLQHGKINKYSFEEFKQKQINDFKEYYKLSEKYKIEFKQFKANAICFAKGFEGAAVIRNKISQSKNKAEILGLFV